ncbi:MAG TPA: hypothetical protein VJ596_10850, partial [Gemmatimonadaceae bacterium]|nr:hypothetical protein [Gemmatimonadaceae bacterium]
TRRLQRVESAPLPASYRALGEAPELRGDSAIKPLLDSLTALEKSREAFGATGGVDPVFIALTARVSEIGEAIQQRAEARRLAMRTELARLGPAPAPVPLTRPTVDTVPLAAARDSAVRAVAQARTALSRAKALHRALDDSIAQANRVASVGASFPAMFGAALVIGLAIAFAVAFVDEGRRPRVSDITEAESAADAKVLARVRMPSNPPERTRRRADREVSPLIERKGESYEALHSQLSRSPGMNPLVITGDEPEVSAIVAANLASASAHRARTTLLIDLDLEERSLAGVLRMPSAPGMADLVSSGADWPALVRQVLVGRDRSIDVIPSGHFEAEEISDVLLQQLWRDLTHMRGRYDAVILHVPQPKAGVLRLLGRLSAPVVVCCRMAGTYLDQLGAMTDSIREAGAPVSGIIAWESDLPILAVSSLTPTTPMRVVAGVSE